MASKRKHNVLTLEKKLEIISDMKKGKSVQCVSGLYDVPKSTVGDIGRTERRLKARVSK
jgi:hypothetical protein